MGEVFEIRTAAQLRVFNAPGTRAVFEALLDRGAEGAGSSAAEVGARAGLSAESAHYHLRKLVRIGLVRETGQRETGARPEKVFALTSRRVELRPGRRGPAYAREVVRGVRLMLRRAEREFERASDHGERFATRPRVGRHMAWLTPDEVGEIDRLEARLDDLIRAADRRARVQGRSGRERVAVTMVLCPVERGEAPAD